MKFENLKTRYLNFIYPKSNTLVRSLRRKSLQSYKIFNQNKNISSEKIDIKKIGKSYVGFYKGYNQISSYSKLDTYKWKNENLLKRVSAIFLIPTKNRVYNNISKNEAFIVLKQKYSEFCFPVFDLTATLKNEAKKILINQKYVFWRDDTHWNNIGMSVASNFITTYLNQIKKNNNKKCLLKIDKNNVK